MHGRLPVCRLKRQGTSSVEVHALGEHLTSLGLRLAALRSNAATQRANAASMGADAKVLLNRKLWLEQQMRIKQVRGWFTSHPAQLCRAGSTTQFADAR